MARTKSVRLGRPTEVTPYLDTITSTPRGETQQVFNLKTGSPFASHQAAAYRRNTILQARKSAKVAIVKVDAGYALVLTGSAKAAVTA